MGFLEDLERAEQAARVLSQYHFQNYPFWAAQMNYSKTFANGALQTQSITLEVMAILGGISRTRLSLEDAIAAAALLEPEPTPSVGPALEPEAGPESGPEPEPD